MPIFHTEVSSKRNDPLLAIAAPREHAKSTLIDTVTTLYELYNQQFHYQIFIGDTATNAQSNLASVVNEIETNELLNEDYGNLKP